jgi:putative ABC transport system ATP-binding protein
MSIVETIDLHKQYGSEPNIVRALDGVSFSLERGEFVAIVGSSGSGKSTLLHILGGVDKPTTGTAIVDGEDIAALDATQAAIYRRRKVGLIYQFYNLIPSLTVKQNILLPLRLDNKQPDPALFDLLVSSLGLEQKLEALPQQLSGGQQQRVAIARSLVYRPALVLADEPTGNLDQRHSSEIVALLKYFNQRLEQTILLITHDDRIAAQADRVIQIEDGRIISDSKRAS